MLVLLWPGIREEGWQIVIYRSPPRERQPHYYMTMSRFCCWARLLPMPRTERSCPKRLL